jgi:AraC-like DNA-binding protein
MTTINAEIRSYKEESGRHEHPFAQVIVPLDGMMEIEVEGRGERLTSSLFAALDVNARHDFQTTKDAHFLVFDISEQVLVENASLAQLFRQRVRAIDACAFRFARYFATELQHRTLSVLPRHLLALSGLALLAEAPAASSRRKYAQRVAAAARWIEDHANLGGSVADLGKRFALSRSHFIALFQRETGRSPKQYEIDTRMARAVDLLLNSEGTISEIAFRVGYENVSAFTRIFTRRLGITPTGFRNRQK